MIRIIKQSTLDLLNADRHRLTTRAESYRTLVQVMFGMLDYRVKNDRHVAKSEYQTMVAAYNRIMDGVQDG